MRRNKSCPLYSQLRPQKWTFVLRHVRFTPESGHVQCKSQCPLWANSGHRGVSFDYFVGGDEQLGPARFDDAKEEEFDPSPTTSSAAQAW
jgi:hypothetical protein